MTSIQNSLLPGQDLHEGANTAECQRQPKRLEQLEPALTREQEAMPGWHRICARFAQVSFKPIRLRPNWHHANSLSQALLHPRAYIVQNFDDLSR